MLVKFSNKVLEFPFTYSLRFKKRIEFENKINIITSHIRKEWGTYSKDEDKFEYDYGYDFVCKSIIESDNLEFINNSIKDYLNRRNDSVIVIETILLVFMKRKGSIILDDDIILKMYSILIDIYDEKVKAFELRYLTYKGVKLLIESVFYKLFLVVRFDYYLSIDELSSLYSNLFFPYFYDFYYLKINKKEIISRKFLSKKVSELKKEGQLKDSDLLECRRHGVLSHYVNGASLNILENNSRKLKQIMTNRKDFFELRSYYFREAIHLMNTIDDDFTNFLELSSEIFKSEWNQLLTNFFNEKMAIINRISLIKAIVEDILSYDNITIDYKKYEEIFWMRYGCSYAYCSRNETKELYYLTMSFLLLYGHRIKLGKFDYRFFKFLCNTYPEYKLTMEKVRQIFEGTKGSTIFSKAFSKFISKIVFLNTEDELISKKLWTQITSFIELHTQKTVRLEVVSENIRYTDRKITQFNKFSQDVFFNILNNTNDLIIQLNKSQIEVISSITEPPRVGEIDPENMQIVGNFVNDKGEKEFGMIENGNYMKIEKNDLFSIKISPRFRFLLSEFFGDKMYRFTMTNNSKEIGRGLIYFFDLDEMGGRYITLDNINHDKNVELRNEDRYGRFTVDLANRNISLTGNGTDSLLGKYRIKLFKLDFNWEEKKITTKAYHMLKGEIIFQFEAID